LPPAVATRRHPPAPPRRSSDLATHSCRPHRGVTQTGHWYSSSGVGWSCTAGSSWCGTRVTLGPMVPHGVDNTARMTTRTRLWARSEEHTSELQSRENLVCRLLL